MRRELKEKEQENLLCYLQRYLNNNLNIDVLFKTIFNFLFI